MARPLTLKDLLKLQFYGLDQLDTETLKALEPVLLRSEAQLRRELDRFAIGSFTRTQKQQTLFLINRSLVRLHNEELREMQSLAEQFNLFGAEMANKEVKDMSRQVGISIPAVKKDKLSLEQNSFLINTMRESVLGHNVDTRMQVSKALTDSVIQKKTGYETVSRIGKAVAIKRWKVKRIVRTEMLRIFNQTKLLTYGEFNEQNFKGRLRKRMFHPMDSRTAEDSKQWASADPAIPLDKPFRLVITRRLASGSVRRTVQEGMTPPLRPNDRATLMSFLPEWKE